MSYIYDAKRILNKGFIVFYYRTKNPSPDILLYDLSTAMAKKRFITIFVLWTLIVSAISAQQSYTDISGSAKIPVFKESFENNSNEWLLDNSWIKGNIANGYYNLVCRNFQKSTGLSFKTISIDQTKDYEIETSVNTLKGTGGLVFGMNSKYDHYRIELTSYNTLVLLKNTPSRGRNEETKRYRRKKTNDRDF